MPGHARWLACGHAAGARRARGAAAAAGGRGLQLLRVVCGQHPASAPPLASPTKPGCMFCVMNLSLGTCRSRVGTSCTRWVHGRRRVASTGCICDRRAASAPYASLQPECDSLHAGYRTVLVLRSGCANECQYQACQCACAFVVRECFGPVVAAEFLSSQHLESGVLSTRSMS